MNDDGPNVVFAAFFAVMGATASMSYGLDSGIAAMIGMHCAAAYDFFGRFRNADNVVEMFVSQRGSAINNIPVWAGAVVIDLLLLGSHYRLY